jgi:hypothetical protein
MIKFNQMNASTIKTRQILLRKNNTNIGNTKMLKNPCAIFLFISLILSATSCSDNKTQKESSNDPTIRMDAKTGRLYSPKTGITFADDPYHYSISGTLNGGQSFNDSILKNKKIKKNGNETVITGNFPGANVEISQVFRQIEDRLEETITLKNTNSETVNLDDIRFGFMADITDRPDWRLCAVPFRIQQDASKHDYSTEDLKKGQYKNAVYVDDRARAPLLTEQGRLRSEAWIWWNGLKGLTVIKYNNNAIELSVAFPEVRQNKSTLQFGGVGYSLYGEPVTAHHLEAGQQITFGTTIYKPFEGTLAKGYSLYRDYLDSRGHKFPADYNPPVNWNELYDIGWYHSDAAKLKKYYTRKAVLEEARKAKALGCEMMYFDPGWEVAEGLTLWDSTRLGSVSSMIKTLKDEYGLDFGYRTILHCGGGLWPKKYLIKHADYEPVPKDEQNIDMLCLNYPEFEKIKLDRILRISKQGVRFMMFDGWNWFGTCVDTSHHHPVPMTTQDFIMAVHKIMREVRQQCPGLIIEAHDPVWPWWTAIYAPTYFQQGFGDKGSHQENWGFEYMWDCINDLKSGRALTLYYYNLGCNIPLYLHITMAADNDNSVFFWWAASTIRHLGIGGKYGLNKQPPGYDPEKRFDAYQKQMKIYKQLKPYFVRGEFHGLAENIHLHTLPNINGGVITAFNLTNEQQQLEFLVPSEVLGVNKKMDVKGADAKWTEKGVVLKLTLSSMSPGVICIGESAKN